MITLTSAFPLYRHLLFTESFTLSDLCFILTLSYVFNTYCENLSSSNIKAFHDCFHAGFFLLQYILLLCSSTFWVGVGGGTSLLQQGSITAD
jgi:hypothetical protein